MDTANSGCETAPGKGLKDLVKFQFFAIRTPDGKILAALFPEIQENRLVVYHLVTGCPEILKRLINIGHIKGNMIHMAILPRS